MTIPSETDVIVAPAPAAKVDNSSYVDWPAIIAGIALASAISLVLLSFGSAIGLSFVNFHAGPDVPMIWIAIAAATWLLWVEVSSFMAGAYLTGRLRRRHHDATEDEADVRDGAHGLLVWAGALVIGGLIAVGGISAAANAVGAAASTLTNAAATVADDAGSAIDPNAYFVDQLFRPSATAATTPPVADTTAVRAETGRILAQGAIAGSVSDPDKAYLAQLVATNTGLTPDEANARVTEVMAAVDKAKADAAAAAETARKAGIVGAFLTAAALLVGAAASFWAAQMGGNHRDQGTVFRTVFRRAR
ncbi:MAG TPA: hypothetical protein VGV07_00920 [Devosia sp.]|jgi:hypothetical protein|uniref:hypothetical protein n=1 Tax=Devosia sp. TaxID=1871048 RepID=UPI002DDCE867|nr:hypothetical protein [Devosia sp.]HEV2513783.1 hypothetical protein [Devosia sp.]